MMQKAMRVLALVAVLALSSGVDAAKRTKQTGSTAVTNSSMSLGDGTVTNSTHNTTVFLGTEYNPDRCVLQLDSVGCNKTIDACGALNGYPLECVKLDSKKNHCECRSNETEVCQNSTAPTFSGVMQFGDCSNNQQCVDSYGHVSSQTELRICAEKVHCVQEINTTATSPASICHTCRSCIAQNDAAGAKLSDKRRFDCTKICPTEILETIAQRNAEGKGIADELSSGEDSSSGSGTEDGASTSGSAAAPAAGSKESAKSSTAMVTLSATTLVASIVVASLSAVLL